jgi:hypothetical protein
LYGVFRAFQPAHRDRLTLQIHIVEAHLANLAGPHALSIGDEHHRPIARASLFRRLLHGDHFLWPNVGIRVGYASFVSFYWRIFTKRSQLHSLAKAIVAAYPNEN